LTKHQGGHRLDNRFVEDLLDRFDVNKPTNELINDVYQIQQRLRKMQEKGTPIYEIDGAARGILERSYKRNQ